MKAYLFRLCYVSSHPCITSLPVLSYHTHSSPPEQPIPFHHELAQTPKPPEYIFFYCDIPPNQGGQTPIIDSTAVYRYAKEHHPDFMNKLQTHGARYIRTLPPHDDPSSPIGRSYQNTWNVKTPQALEERLTQLDGCSWQWLDDGSVRITTEPVPALRLVTTQYQYAFANSLVAAYLGWQDSRNNRLDALRFGNMDPMPHHVLDDIASFMQQHRVMYKWKQGDIMALHNSLVMHSRNPFVGPRRVLASIWGPPLDKPLLQHRGPADPLVFGFWKVPQDVCAQVCYQAIRAGYRRLDCACDYGNEAQVGQGIARAIAEKLVTREELFVTSKLWNTFHQHVALACEKSLQDLQLDYLDEYLIHFPISLEYVPIESKYPPEWTNLEGKMVSIANDIGQTWKDMEVLVESGKCRNIGVCNFSTQLLRHILSICRIRPSTLQIELHPHNTQEKLVRFAHEQGLQVTAFSVFGASSYLELGMAQDDDVLMKDPVVLELAMKHNKTPAQILLRWAVQRHTLALSKTCNTERLCENRNIFDFYLSVWDMQALNGLNRNRRYNDPGDFCEPGMGTFYPIYE